MKRKVPSRYASAVLLTVALSVVLLAAGCATNGAGSIRTTQGASEPAPPANSPPANTSIPQKPDLVFAVAGDSRSEQAWLDPHEGFLDLAPKPDYRDYISKSRLSALNHDLIKNWGDSPGFFLVHVGDFGIRGGKPVFDAFKSIMSPMKKAKIPVYPAIGNHELRYYGPPKTSDAETYASASKAQDDYQDAFTKPWMMPSGASFPDDYGRLAYSFKRGTAAFVVLDAYYVNDDEKKYKKGYYSDTQLRWLQDTLIAFRKDPSVKQLFVMSHQPVFDAAKGDGSFYKKYNYPKSARSGWILWALLDTYKVDAFFCGHSHFYHRWNVVGDRFAHRYNTDRWDPLGTKFKASKIETYAVNQLGWQTTIPQVVNGSCGAGLQGFDGNSLPAEVRKKAYNFSIVSVAGDITTVKVYSYTAKKGKAKHKLIDAFQKQNGQWQNLPLTEEAPAADASTDDES